MSVKIRSEWYGCDFDVTQAYRDELLPHEPRTYGWLIRFNLVTTSEKWPEVNALHVDGVIDRKGNWIADFQEPTVGNPTNL